MAFSGNGAGSDPGAAQYSATGAGAIHQGLNCQVHGASSRQAAGSVHQFGDSSFYQTNGTNREGSAQKDAKITMIQKPKTGICQS